MTRMDVLDSARQEKDAELKALAKGGARDLTNQYPLSAGGTVTNFAWTALTAIATSSLVETLVGQIGESRRGSRKCPPLAGGHFHARAVRARTCAWHGGLGSASAHLHRANHV